MEYLPNMTPSIKYIPFSKDDVSDKAQLVPNLVRVPGTLKIHEIQVQPTLEENAKLFYKYLSNLEAKPFKLKFAPTKVKSKNSDEEEEIQDKKETNDEKDESDEEEDTSSDEEDNESTEEFEPDSSDDITAQLEEDCDIGKGDIAIGNWVKAIYDNKFYAGIVLDHITEPEVLFRVRCLTKPLGDKDNMPQSLEKENSVWYQVNKVFKLKTDPELVYERRQIKYKVVL